MIEPIAREIVLIGGGHSHALFLRMLGMKRIPGLRVTLVSPEFCTPYSGMLPGLVAGHYTEEEAYIDLGPLCRFADAALVVDQVEAIDPVRQLVRCRAHPDLRYDVVSLDIGVTPLIPPGLADDNMIPVKPISSFLARWRTFLAGFEEGPVQDIGVVGAGAGGVELVFAMQHYFGTNYPAPPCFHLFTESDLLPGDIGSGARRRLGKRLVDRNITLHRNFRVSGFDGKHLLADDGSEVAVDVAFLVTDAAAQPWPGEGGLAVDERGFIRVRDTLQSVNHGNVFAVGDCADMINYPRPKAGVYAVRQGKPLFRNLVAYTLGRKPAPFRPQSRFLSLISTGEKYALGTRNGLAVSGRWVWEWKNRIDRRFMERFRNFPEMPLARRGPLAHEFDDQMQCGGCGSKVSADILEEVLNELTGDARPLDDAARLRIPAGKIALQSVDHFRSFYGDPYVLARIAVVHAMSDIYACGGRVQAAQVLLTLPFAKPGVTRSLLSQLMAGTLEALETDGTLLAGGHTSEGQELCIGFAVTGHVDEGEFLAKQGLEPGDRLVLTKPLGTGTLFAADMQMKAKGCWIGMAIDSMQLSNRGAAEILTGYKVHACTDVTGFGLAGHLREMLKGSGLGARLEAETLPVLPGAGACLEELGVRSGLHAANERFCGFIGKAPPILFDPQTSGGLLFGIAADGADSCVADLKEAGYPGAAIVGDVTDDGILAIK